MSSQANYLLLGQFGAPWATRDPSGCQARFGDLANAKSPQIVARSTFLELVAGATEVTAVTAVTEVVQKWLLRPQPQCTPGARMTVVTQTPSNKQY